VDFRLSETTSHLLTLSFGGAIAAIADDDESGTEQACLSFRIDQVQLYPNREANYLVFVEKFISAIYKRTYVRTYTHTARARTALLRCVLRET
jgi:hypothetical protein